jgi:hypothetical protein
MYKDVDDDVFTVKKRRISRRSKYIWDSGMSSLLCHLSLIDEAI